MGTSLLLVSTATQWFGTARIPRAFAEAGFEVSLLTPPNSLAEKSRFVAGVGHLPDNATALEWVFAFAAMVDAASPRIVVPCDDTAFRLLGNLAMHRPPAVQPALHQQLCTLIHDSLGDPAWYRTSVDKMLLPPAASALGVRVPPSAIVSTVAAAESFAAAHGYPVVLKRRQAFAGAGVAIVADRGELMRAFTSLMAADRADEADARTHELLVQAHVRGQAQYYALAAWRGALLAGWAADKVVSSPEATGPSTVIRCHREPEVRDFSQRLVRGFGISGLLSLDCVIQAGTGQAYLLEINRRVTPGTHRGRALGVDLCAALCAALNGQPLGPRVDMDEGEEQVNALFPQEWLRDPDSPHLREEVVDVPWDEPELIEALLALRRG